eukprot:7146466-Heterocapsa_arctica.AAC.1
MVIPLIRHGCGGSGWVVNRSERGAGCEPKVERRAISEREKAGEQGKPAEKGSARWRQTVTIGFREPGKAQQKAGAEGR